MIEKLRLAAIAGLALTVSACAGPAIPRPATPSGGPPPPPTTVVRPVQNNALIGSSADAIGRMFGKPHLDITEGAGRKLQFTGSTCIIDIYLYAPRAGANPVATHVDARTPDGRNADVNSCAQSLQR